MESVLRGLTGLYGPSGHERQVRQYIGRQVSPCADRLREDAAGNLAVCRKGRSSARTVMVMASMDQAGLRIIGQESGGMMRAAIAGNLAAERMHGADVVFADGTIGIVNAPREGDILIDCRIADAAVLPKPGDVAIFSAGLRESGDVWIGGALADRVGCCVLIEAVRSGEVPAFDTWFVFTARHYHGQYGARFAARAIRPDLAIAVGAVRAEEETNRVAFVRPGDGPVIRLRDGAHIAHDEVGEHLTAAAQSGSIPCQRDADSAGGVSDAAAVHIAGAGVPTGMLAVPVRYAGSPNELCRRSDVWQTSRLLTQAIVMESGRHSQ